MLASSSFFPGKRSRRNSLRTVSVKCFVPCKAPDTCQLLIPTAHHLTLQPTRACQQSKSSLQAAPGALKPGSARPSQEGPGQLHGL